MFIFPLSTLLAQRRHLWANRSVKDGPGNLITKEAFLRTGGYNQTVFTFEDQYFFEVAARHRLKIKHDGKVKMYFLLRRVGKDGVLGYFYFNLYAALHFIFTC